MFKKLTDLIKSQAVFFSGVLFGVITASVTAVLMATTTNTELLDVATVLDLLECYEERAHGEQ